MPVQPLVRERRILLVPLLTATSAFRLGRRRWSFRRLLPAPSLYIRLLPLTADIKLVGQVFIACRDNTAP